MAEPMVSYKGLEETSTFNVVQHLVVASVMISLFMPSGSVDAVPTTALSVEHQDVLLTQRSPVVLNDSSMPALAEDNQDLSSSYDSFHSSYEDSGYSLPISVEVADHDDGDLICSADQYLEPSVNACRNCTTCGPGMQHKIDQTCGYGDGVEQICEPCDDGYYQDRTSSNLVRCKRCITCDRITDTLRKCSLVHDAVCGPCPPGMYYFSPNLCVDCEDGGSDKEECKTNTGIPTTVEVTRPTPQLSPTAAITHTLPLSPVEINIPSTWAKILTQTKGIKIPTTEQTVHGVEKRSGVGVAIALVVLAILLAVLVFGAYKLLLKRGVHVCAHLSDKDEGKNAENVSTCANPGLRSDGQVHVNIQNGAVLYRPVSQQEPSQDVMELSLPQSLRSDLPIGQSPIVAVCSCKGQEVLWQDAPPASLPREDDAVPL